MDALTIVAVVVVAGVTFGIARAIAVREKRRRQTWLQRDRYHQPLPTVRVAQKLGIQRADARDDVGLQLRDAVDRKIAELPVRDDDARIAEVERLVREREWR